MFFKNIIKPKIGLPAKSAEAVEVEKKTVEDAMEPISAEAMKAIGNAKQLLIEILEYVDKLEPESKAPFTDRVKKLREVVATLQSSIEKLMEIGEPKVLLETLIPTEFFTTSENIKKLSHGPAVAVIDKNALLEGGILLKRIQQFAPYIINWDDFSNFIAMKGLVYYMMKKISVEDAKKVAKKLKVQPAKNTVLPIYYFAEKEDYITEIITWERLEDALKTLGLAIYNLNDEWLWVMKPILVE